VEHVVCLLCVVVVDQPYVERLLKLPTPQLAAMAHLAAAAAAAIRQMSSTSCYKMAQLSEPSYMQTEAPSEERGADVAPSPSLVVYALASPGGTRFSS
jgi:hypothetical protein